MIREAIKKLLAHNDLTENESAAVMTEIMQGQASPSQMAAYLMGLRFKGETVDELVGSASSMRKHAIPAKINNIKAIDLCGTGGDGKNTFNISTTAAFVVAGCGVKVAKHGNRAASSKCGSSDLLEELGITVNFTPEQVTHCIEKFGMGFMFAPLFHPAMKNVSAVRKELGIRTIFNILGPMVNPAGVTTQLIGVFNPRLLEKIASTLLRLGTKNATIVHGQGGYDEATTTDTNEVIFLRSNKILKSSIEPEKFGFSRARPETLKGGTPAENARITHRILEGESGPRADTVLLNAGLALYTAGAGDDLSAGIALARQSIKSGKAGKVLEQLVEFSRSLAKENL